MTFFVPLPAGALVEQLGTALNTCVDVIGTPSEISDAVVSSDPLPWKSAGAPAE